MSRFRDDRLILVKHRHCSVCHIPIQWEKRFCSPKCESEYGRGMRRQRYSLLVTTMLIPAVFMVILILSATR